MGLLFFVLVGFIQWNMNINMTTCLLMLVFPLSHGKSTPMVLSSQEGQFLRMTFLVEQLLSSMQSCGGVFRWGWKWFRGLRGCRFSMLPSLKAEKRLMLPTSCAGVRNADWFSSMPSSRCSKRALKVHCGPFERRIFLRGKNNFSEEVRVCWTHKTIFPVVHTYLHLNILNGS